MTDPAPSHSRTRVWLLAARPRTLTAAVAPVVVGNALAHLYGAFKPAVALATLLAAVFIQVGTNLANDVADWERGADTGERLGPLRVVQAGLLSPQAVWRGAAAAFGIAALLGLYLVQAGGWPILVLGVAAIVSGYAYTAGPHPLAYRGLGDVFVLTFFGILAVAGSVYVQAQRVTIASLGLGLGVGALAVTILAVNNLRDRPTDAAAGKLTLAVRMGETASRRYAVATIAVAAVCPTVLVAAGQLPAGALACLLVLPMAAAPVRALAGTAAGRQLNPVLGQVARLQMAYAVVLALGIVI